MNANFPYTVNVEFSKLDDGRCCNQTTDHTGFHFFRCNHPAKAEIDGVGFCGIHARSIKRWREITK